jgi:glycosyltransferase involved in cell wall biosynthesis
MRVLLVNKFFRPGAGAETAFFATRELLADAGHEIVDFAMAGAANAPSADARYFAPERSYAPDGARLRRIRDAGASVYSLAARRAIRRLVQARRPDLAHLHNVYHQLTLSIVDELARQGVPVVMTLHDYKLVCPAYTLYTEGAPCRRCVSGHPLHVIPHRCIKGSTAASALGAAEAVLARARGSYRRVDAFIAPSRFLAGLAATAVPAERVHVVPNFLAAEPPSEAVLGGAREPVALYAGRLEAVKGVRELLSAFERIAAPGRLEIAGDGPLRPLVLAAAAREPRIRYLGRLSGEDVAARLRRASVMVLPSLWEENCPMSVLEARAAGAPVVCASSGGLPELVTDGRDGLLVDPRDAGALAAAVERLIGDGALRAAMARNGAERFTREHRPERHRERLLAVYRSAAGLPSAGETERVPRG